MARTQSEDEDVAQVQGGGAARQHQPQAYCAQPALRRLAADVRPHRQHGRHHLRRMAQGAHRATGGEEGGAS